MDAERNIKKRFTVSMVTSLILDKNFESDSSQSSESEHENEDETLRDMQTLYCTLMGSKARGKMIATEKITDYVDRVIPNYSDIAFKEYFRMFPATFEMILSLIGPALNKTNTITRRKPISAEKQLYITLWFMATPDSYRSVCVKFGVGKITAFRAVRRVTYALHCMAPRFIQWPDKAVATNISDQFLEASGFPNVIGAIDGTHIKIRAPPTDSVSYINRKGFPSINLQVVCNSRGLFTHCYAGQVGSVHDARVFKNSPVAHFLERPEVYFPNNSHIIGDAAYPIHPHVMVPFRDNGHLTNQQKNFNYCLSSTRMAVERAIGQLKISFRILLDCLPLTDVKKIPEFIIACSVLHNICLLQNDVMTVGVQHHEEYQAQIRDNNTDLGNAKRIVIMNALPIKINA
ncbi:PREDICTED: putative nuclease HARBI1 [Trachymyrmex cornetzi]|uniref:putative nuclease HARBI1 n=1 Tax=Trachymyrmex cornetzi TaxID=471704 RepID=UPI00084F52A6|nr:PREDICTED: putative nuclease HARBI1 [Trachymyrmex cornetzi]